MRTDFIEAIHKHQREFGLDLTEAKIGLLADFYAFVGERNDLLHLVAPVSAAEFAVRHVLESLTLLEFLPEKTTFADVGTGAGLPSIPCLLVREDLRGVLIEAKFKKAEFLGEVLEKFNLKDRAQVINRQFEEIEKPRVAYITCRALDKFTKKLPKLLRWANGAGLLFFGGNNLGAELEKSNVRFERKLTPMSDKRFLFVSGLESLESSESSGSSGS